MNKSYYPRRVNPIHPVHSWAKVRRLARAAANGQEITPILLDGENLLAGTHRSAANDILEHMGHGHELIESVQLDDVIADPEQYGLDEDQVSWLIYAAENGEFQIIQEIWDEK